MADQSSDKALSTSVVVRSILVALGVVLLLFLLFEVAEIMWLYRLEMELLHKLYIIRGLFISLIAVILVG